MKRPRAEGERGGRGGGGGRGKIEDREESLSRRAFPWRSWSTNAFKALEGRHPPRRLQVEEEEGVEEEEEEEEKEEEKE